MESHWKLIIGNIESEEGKYLGELIKAKIEEVGKVDED